MGKQSLPEHPAFFFSWCQLSHLLCLLQTGQEQHIQPFLVRGFGFSLHHQVSMGKGDLESHCQSQFLLLQDAALK